MSPNNSSISSWLTVLCRLDTITLAPCKGETPVAPLSMRSPKVLAPLSMRSPAVLTSDLSLVEGKCGLV